MCTSSGRAHNSVLRCLDTCISLCSCSRAYLKIEEAFTALNLGAHLAHGAVAVDLGKFCRQCRVHIVVKEPSPLFSKPVLQPRPWSCRRGARRLDVVHRPAGLPRAGGRPSRPGRRGGGAPQCDPHPAEVAAGRHEHPAAAAAARWHGTAAAQRHEHTSDTGKMLANEASSAETLWNCTCFMVLELYISHERAVPMGVPFLSQMAIALRPLLQHVQPGGWVVVTLKMRGCGRDRSRWLQELPRLLSCRFRAARLLWLCANTEYKTTFCGQLEAVEDACQ